MQFEWWYWIMLGMVLLGAELLIPSFTMVWFGLGAFIVGMVVFVWSGLLIAGQLLIWAVMSISCTSLWCRRLDTGDGIPSI